MLYTSTNHIVEAGAPSPMRRACLKRVLVIHRCDLRLDGNLVQRLAVGVALSPLLFAHMQLYGMRKPPLQRGWIPSGLRQQARRVDDANRQMGWLVRQTIDFKATDTSNDES